MTDCVEKTWLGRKLNGPRNWYILPPIASLQLRPPSATLHRERGLGIRHAEQPRFPIYAKLRDIQPTTVQATVSGRSPPQCVLARPARSPTRRHHRAMSQAVRHVGGPCHTVLAREAWIEAWIQVCSSRGLVGSDGGGSVPAAGDEDSSRRGLLPPQDIRARPGFIRRPDTQLA
jgi:hypothetical protein